MAAIIRMTPESIRLKSNECKNISSEMQELQQKMETLFHQIDSEWDGDRKEALMQAYENLTPNLVKMINQVDLFADYALESANRLEQADNQVASML